MEQQKLFDFIAKCKGYINKEIAAQNWNNVLALVSTTASIIYESNLYYFDEDLENTIALVAKKLNLTHLNLTHGKLTSESYKANQDIILFYDGFGLNNRGLIQIYLTALAKTGKHIVYITYEKRKENIPDIKKILSSSNAECYFLRTDSYVNTINQLSQLISEKRPAHFFFYSMPGDVVGTVIMASYESFLHRYQINLTDHSFWLGAKCIDVCIEFRDYGARISNEYRKISKEKIVKIPYYPIVLDTPFQGYPFSKKDEQKVVFSGGSLYKTNGENNTYYKIVDYILANHPDVIFWYAGSKWNADSTELEKILKKYPARAYWTEERKDLLQVLQHSDLYLSTYPMIGGLMTQYAARAGIVPVSLMLDNTLSEGLLFNEDQLNINFHSVDLMIEEIDHLLNDSKYAYERGQVLSQSLISPEVFNREVEKLLLYPNNEARLLDGNKLLNHKNESLTQESQEKTPIEFDENQIRQAFQAFKTCQAFKINYIDHIDTSKLRSVQTAIYTEEKLENAIATRHNKFLFKYFPAKFARGGTQDSKDAKEEAEETCETHGWNPLYEISFIVVSYNSSFERIKKTLVSFLDQEDVHFEIIVADDGSEDNHQEEIERLFFEYGFKDYKMLMHTVNRGTVLNQGSAVAIAQGEYIKGLGPGDYLYDKHTIRNWLDFLKESGAQWSISDAIYYDKDTGNVISMKAHPQNMKPYKRHDVNRIRWNYVVLSDIAVGVVMLSKADLQKRYSQRIETKGIKYAEDNMWRLMMFDGIVASYYEKPTVYYEYGGGISTSKSKYWSERLRMDWIKADEMMQETKDLDEFQKEMLKCMKQNGSKNGSNSFLDKILINIITRGKFVHKLKTKFFPRKTLKRVIHCK